MKTNMVHAADVPHFVLHRRFWSTKTQSHHDLRMVADHLDPEMRPTLDSVGNTPAAVCRYTPREMAELSLDLFLAGVLTDEEYALLAFQPELHPDFDRTIGALTGECAKPDQRRDYVASWKDRLEFERGRARPDPTLIARIQRILFVLCRLGTPAEAAVCLR